MTACIYMSIELLLVSIYLFVSNDRVYLPVLKVTIIFDRNVSQFEF